ncbi:DUF2264 domain-containing protein [Arthrobacter sp. H35-D1]|uniref:DUF2264 domain-containing protein n=1 Tax=Arthrobacter sp. H35-D1 TaxID=3046202 RepID=UPI0024BBE445|nr:DUF2264 domain-containing protein [Arthrobacter sp. H35-D1]MDJ0314518.1 DUF2264 domain-containing protein [Arthrobacter sp. H35-D1]
MIEMPHHNWAVSPLTGFTREHWLAAADAQLGAVRPFATAEHALISLPGTASMSGEVSDGLEGFARTFILAAFRVAGEAGEDPHGHLDFYRSGLLAGTDAASAHPWPRIDVTRQALVEAASLVLGLHLSRTWLWDTLSIQEQDQVIAWLDGAAGMAVPDNNWVMFKVMVQEFIASTGRPFHQADIEHGLARIEDWYIGDGWYSDGDGQRFDYYAGWAMHLYPCLWTFMAAPRVPELAAQKAALYKERLANYLQDFPYFFGGNGAPLFQGRSLIYRLGATAPLWLGEIMGVGQLAPGATRALGSAALRYFNDGGAFGENNVLSCGWFGTFRPMTQVYSGPGSPYWASKGFLGLLLPADHPVWTDVEQAGPVATDDSVRVLHAPGFLLSSTAADGVVRLANHGSDNYPGIVPGDDPHYSRLAYSTHTAPEYCAPLDNHMAVLDILDAPSRRTVIHRRQTTTPDTLASAHRPVWGDEAVETDSPWRISSATAVRGPWELRVHVVESDTPQTAMVREGGYAAPAHGAVTSHLIPVLGTGLSGLEHALGTNPMAAETLIPWRTGEHSGTRSVHGSLAVLTGDPEVSKMLKGFDPARLMPVLEDNSIEGQNGALTLTITAPDGKPLAAGLLLEA